VEYNCALIKVDLLAACIALRVAGAVFVMRCKIIGAPKKLKMAPSLISGLELGLATEFRSEKIPRNRLGMVSVIPRKKVLIPRHSEVYGRDHSEARNGRKWHEKKYKKSCSSLQQTECFQRGNFLWISLFIVRYSPLPHLPPLRFYCVEGYWDRTQDSCDYCIDCQTL
jgi:hypothetical protein